MERFSSRSYKSIRFFCRIGLCLLSTVLAQTVGNFDGLEIVTAQTRRPVTVADCIRMTRFGDPYYAAGGSAHGLVAKFSPDGERFVVVVKKGNLELNTNEYSLLLWETVEVGHSPPPEAVLTLASSSNREGIKDINWIDNTHLVFLGEGPGELQQLYSFDLKDRRLATIVKHSTNLLSYARSSDGNRVVFAAQTTATSLLTDESRRRGIYVSTQFLSDLISGQIPSDEQFFDSELFVKDKAGIDALPINLTGKLWNELTISPDGKYVVVPTEVPTIRESWCAYKDKYLATALYNAVRSKQLGGSTGIYQYTLVDLEKHVARPLLDAPMGLGLGGSEIVWAPDSRSVVVAGVWLPLDGTDPEERKVRQTSRFVTEIEIPSLQVLKITQDDLRLIGWNPRKDCLIFEAGRVNSITGRTSVPKVYYRKIGTRWEKIDASKANETAEHPDVILEEDLNTRPKVVVVNPKTGQRSSLLDLNPQFAELSLTKVQEVRWNAIDGHEVTGGLYLPPDYVEGKKYPLVIQTHGFNPKRFWIDGPYGATAFAAQPLASKGFVVLQADESFEHYSTPEEVRGEVSAIEGAIDYLDHRGIVDRTRVGLIGFSRTGLFVKYALTHSTYRFAAASVADGTEADYFPYLALYNSLPWLASDMETMNGGVPFEEGMSSWLENAPGFSLSRVHTPFLAQTLGPTSLLLGWQWIAGLRRLGKPVEMIYMPKASHTIVRPWERQTSLQANVDWFCFWLKGEEDPDPAKAEQYARWRELRKLQEQNVRQPQQPNPPSVH